MAIRNLKSPDADSANDRASSRSLDTVKLAFNADAAAITIALAFAILIRLNVIRHVGW